MMVNIAPTLIVVSLYRVPTLHRPRIWPPIKPTRVSIPPSPSNAESIPREPNSVKNDGGSDAAGRKLITSRLVGVAGQLPVQSKTVRAPLSKKDPYFTEAGNPQKNKRPKQNS